MYIDAIKAAGAVVHDHMRIGHLADWPSTELAFVTYESNTGVVLRDESVHTCRGDYEAFDRVCDGDWEEARRQGRLWLEHIYYVSDAIEEYEKMAGDDADIHAVVAKLKEWAAWEWDMRVDWHDPEWEDEKRRGGYRLYPDA